MVGAEMDKIVIKIEPFFWVAFTLLIIVTGWIVPGWLQYDYLPDELFDENHHEIIEYHYAEGWPEGLTSLKVADEWKDNKTGEEFSSKGFSEHRKEEAVRISVTAFLYGLIGCIFNAAACKARKKWAFFAGFKYALFVNVAIAVFLFINIY